jgi:hypothetical protein
MDKYIDNYFENQYKFHHSNTKNIIENIWMILRKENLPVEINIH